MHVHLFCSVVYFPWIQVWPHATFSGFICFVFWSLCISSSVNVFNQCWHFAFRVGYNATMLVPALLHDFCSLVYFPWIQAWPHGTFSGFLCFAVWSLTIIGLYITPTTGLLDVKCWDRNKQSLLINPCWENYKSTKCPLLVAMSHSQLTQIYIVCTRPCNP